MSEIPISKNLVFPDRELSLDICIAPKTSYGQFLI